MRKVCMTTSLEPRLISMDIERIIDNPRVLNYQVSLSQAWDHYNDKISYSAVIITEEEG